MGYRHVRGGYGRSGGFEVWRDVFAFNPREPVIMSLIAEICRPTFSHRAGLRTRSSSRWMRRRCRSAAGACIRGQAQPLPPRPRNTGTEPRAGGTGATSSPRMPLALATPEPNPVQRAYQQSRYTHAGSASQHRNRTPCRRHGRDEQPADATSPSQHRNRTPCNERINKSDTRTQARPRNTGTEPRAGGTGATSSPRMPLALATPEPNLVQGMPGLQSTFATRLTRFHGQQGPGLQGRSKAPLVEDSPHLARVGDYIPLHPVRAGVVTADRAGE